MFLKKGDYIISMKCLLYFRLFSLVLFVPLFSCCRSFSETEAVEFYLPYSSVWRVKISENGKYRVYGNTFRIAAMRNSVTAVVAVELNGQKKYGAIYPYNFSLTEENAFPALVLYSMMEGSVNSNSEKEYCLSTFNWEKFEEACHVLGQDVWKVDKEEIMVKIAKGTFKKSDLKPQ